jgi:hypothetical protein
MATACTAGEPSSCPIPTTARPSATIIFTNLGTARIIGELQTSRELCAPLSCFPVQARPSIPERHSRKEVITVLISAAWDHSGRSPTTEKRPSWQKHRSRFTTVPMTVMEALAYKYILPHGHRVHREKPCGLVSKNHGQRQHAKSCSRMILPNIIYKLRFRISL